MVGALYLLPSAGYLDSGLGDAGVYCRVPRSQDKMGCQTRRSVCHSFHCSEQRVAVCYVLVVGV